MLALYNTLSHRKEIFKPIREGEVGLYVCGVTVYDDCHIGHARVLVFFDVLLRWFEAFGYKVHYVRNITDVDDKIIAKAAELGESIESLTERMIESMHEDMQKLKVKMPEVEPRATQWIDAMIAMIQALIEKDLAYAAANGDVYFHVRAFPGYGKLSGKAPDDLLSGARVAIEPHKRDALDFVLWKAAKPNEPAWDSPWGRGRPGWHIECSAMSTHLLGPHFDIHGGGADLMFPHHENEIAQSEGATGEPLANYWVHVGLVQIKGEKMSKSVGNIMRLRDLYARFNPEVIRFFLLQSHYRSALNYTEESMAVAARALSRLYGALRGFQPLETTPIDWQVPEAVRFRKAMEDDFNTPEAIAVLFELAHRIYKGQEEKAEIDQKASLLKNLGHFLGLFSYTPEEILAGDSGDHKRIESLIEERIEARRQKDWARADAIRDMLLQEGVILEDTPSGTRWRKAP